MKPNPKSQSIRFEISSSEVIEIKDGILTSNLHDDLDIDKQDDPYDHAIHGIESLILSMYMNGVNIDTPEIRDAIATSVEHAANMYL